MFFRDSSEFFLDKLKKKEELLFTDSGSIICWLHENLYVWFTAKESYADCSGDWSRRKNPFSLTCKWIYKYFVLVICYRPKKTKSEMKAIISRLIKKKRSRCLMVISIHIPLTFPNLRKKKICWYWLKLHLKISDNESWNGIPEI